MSDYSLKNLRQIEDAAAKYGLSEMGESRFAREDLDAERTGLAYHVLKPGKRQSFGHRHDEAEELHVVMSGSGRVRLEDELVHLAPLDALRIGPKVTRAFEAGPEGLTFLVFGPHHEGDSEMVQDFWTD